MNTPTFYMVFVENGHNPTCKHATYELALTEAKRLSEALKMKAYVLQALTKVEKVQFEITQLINDELPF